MCVFNGFGLAFVTRIVATSNSSGTRCGAPPSIMAAKVRMCLFVWCITAAAYSCMCRRAGLPLQAISAVDLALWDVLGKYRNEV